MVEDDFRSYFSKFGEIEEVRVIHKTRKNGTKKNFCFVMFKSPKSFQAVLNQSTHHIIKGIEIHCRQIKLREELKNIQIENQKQKKIKDM